MVSVLFVGWWGWVGWGFVSFGWGGSCGVVVLLFVGWVVFGCLGVWCCVVGVGFECLLILSFFLGLGCLVYVGLSSFL